jgi:hypothetical protein
VLSEIGCADEITHFASREIMSLLLAMANKKGIFLVKFYCIFDGQQKGINMKFYTTGYIIIYVI